MTQESGQRPDAVMASKKTDTIIIAELTVPWEDRMEQSNVLKENRYSELTIDLIDKGYRVHFFAIEVGARGLMGRSSYTFLRERLACQVEKGTKLWNECQRLPERLPIGCGQNETVNSMSSLSSQW